jgi:predicted RNA-binding Zn ribbon-like protein
MVAKTAPDRLELVQAFINTADLEENTEQLDSVASLGRWLAERGLGVEDQAPPDCDEKALETALGMREALRALCLVNNGVEPDREALKALEDVTANLHLHLRARFAVDRPLYLEPDEPGVAGSLGAILTIVFEAMQDGTWSKLKACASPTCRWAFYDHSKNHSGRWCSMAVCGNRTKVQSYRARQVPVAS